MTEASLQNAECVECGKPPPPSDELVVEGETFCRSCWRGLTGIPATETYEAGREGRDGAEEIPWRRIPEIGLFHAFLSTVWGVFRHTTRFFSCIHHGEQPGRPVLYVAALLLFVVPGTILNTSIMLWSVAYVSQFDEGMREEMEPMLKTFFVEEDGRLKLNSRMQLAQLFMLPVQFLLLDVFLASLIQQIILAMMRGSRDGDYAVTLQVRCYSLSGQLLVILPIIGFIAAPLASLALNVRGLQVSQRLSVGQALVVGAAPFCIYIVLQVFFVMLRLVGFA